jgi:hypothetical protein
VRNRAKIKLGDRDADGVDAGRHGRHREQAQRQGDQLGDPVEVLEGGPDG